MLGCQGAALILCLLLPAAGRAQTDEIQVYTAEINDPGQFSITLHNNYTVIGPTRPAFSGGIVPDHSLNGGPIVGWRFGPVDLILNPIMDLPFHGGAKALTFAPADRIAYNLSKTWTLAIEHYADYGGFANFEPLGQQFHALFGVIDYNADPFSVEFGVGHGFTTASEPLILKLMLVRTF
jgi:hypothetical protein